MEVLRRTDQAGYYAVELIGTVNGTVQGNLYELDYQQHFQHIRDASAVGANPSDLRKWDAGDWPKSISTAAGWKYFRSSLRHEMQPMLNFCSHPARCCQPRTGGPVVSKTSCRTAHWADRGRAQRIATNVKRLAAPTARTENHFMSGECRPIFHKLASSRGHGPTACHVAVQVLHLSSVKDRFGIYAR